GRGRLLFDLLCHFGLPPQFTSVRDSASHEVLLSVRLLLLGGRADHPCRGLLGTEWTWARVNVTGEPRHSPASWGEDAAAASSPLKVPGRMDVMRTQRVSALPAPARKVSLTTSPTRSRRTCSRSSTSSIPPLPHLFDVLDLDRCLHA